MKRVGRVLGCLVVLALVIGIAFLVRPLLVARQFTHFGLFAAQIQSNYVMTPEGRVHYYEGQPLIPGGGIPLVLVHGLADRSESWAPMLKKLKRAGFHVYALDLLGYGRSPKPAGSDYSIATQEQLVADFIQALGLQKPDIGGWSMGGWVTLKLALDHPEMVDRVVVFDSAGLTFEHAGLTHVFHPDDEAGVDRVVTLLGPDIKPLPGFVRRDLLRSFQSNQWVIDRSVQSMLDGKDVLDARLGQLTNPLLIVWGGEDHLTPLSVGQQMHTLVPASELDIIEGCGHVAPNLCSSRVASAAADFLKANPVPAGSVRTLAQMH